MVRIITDSAADFEPFELEKWNISCVPQKVMIGEAEYEENLNLGKSQFFKPHACSDFHSDSSISIQYECCGESRENNKKCDGHLPPFYNIQANVRKSKKKSLI